MDPLIILFGFGVGILVGTTGIGGGSLMTPILILVFGFKPTTAIGTDLAYGAVTKTVGGYRHWRQKTVDFGLSTWMAFGSVPAAIGGVVVLHLLEDAFGKGFDNALLIAVAAALLLTGLVILARLLLPSAGKGERHTTPLERRHKIAAIALGASVGFVLGITSAGSGSLIAVGRRDRARGRRQRGLRAGGHDPDRLDPRRLGGLRADDAAARRRDARHAR